MNHKEPLTKSIGCLDLGRIQKASSVAAFSPADGTEEPQATGTGMSYMELLKLFVDVTHLQKGSFTNVRSLKRAAHPVVLRVPALLALAT